MRTRSMAVMAVMAGLLERIGREGERLAFLTHVNRCSDRRHPYAWDFVE